MLDFSLAQGKECTYKVTMRCVRVAIVTVKVQWVIRTQGVVCL